MFWQSYQENFWQSTDIDSLFAPVGVKVNNKHQRHQRTAEESQFATLRNKVCRVPVVCDQQFTGILSVVHRAENIECVWSVRVDRPRNKNHQERRKKLTEKGEEKFLFSLSSEAKAKTSAPEWVCVDYIQPLWWNSGWRNSDIFISRRRRADTVGSQKNPLLRQDLWRQHLNRVNYTTLHNTIVTVEGTDR